MNLRIEGSFLKSAVARRVFALFVLSAFVPVAILASLSYQHVRRLVNEYALQQLAQTAGAHSRVVYDRLLDAHFMLNADAAQIRTDSDFEIADESALHRVFQRGYFVSGAGESLQFGQKLDSPLPSLTPAALAHLAKGEAALLPPAIGAMGGAPWLAVAIDPAHPSRSYVMAEFDSRFLWGERSDFSYRSDICIFAGNEAVLYCTDDALGSLAAKATFNGNEDSPTGAAEWLFASSALFLRAKFGSPDWTVVVMRPGGVAGASFTLVAQTFLGIVVLTLLLVTLLSSIQIRRTLVPLERLIDGTKRIALEDFDQPVRVEGNDEFAQLAQALNTMSGRLGRQIGAMRALSGIDQEILSRLDIEQVLGLVHARLLEILPNAVITSVVFKDEAAAIGTAYWKTRDSDGLVRGQVRLKPGFMATSTGYREGFWTRATAFSPEGAPEVLLRFVALDVPHFFALPIMWRDEVRGALLVGLMSRDGVSDEILGQVRDLGKRVSVALAAQAREDELVFHAHHDALTGLPNRTLLRERLHLELAHARRDGSELALLFLDLDRFKSINDTLGHDGGDQLLCECAKRLVSSVREGDTVARLGGDEFVVLLTGLNGSMDVAKLAGQMLALLSQSFEIAGVECFVGASIGISVYPSDGTTADALLKNADIAMYRAKDNGRNCFIFFEESMNLAQQQRAVIERELRLAMERGQLSVQYQPRITLQGDKLLGAEALLRWQHPELGWVSPAVFIPIAEDIGLIAELGAWVLRHACGQLATWQASGYAIGSISVNVSGRQLKTEDLVAEVRDALSASNLPPEALEFEVTEGVLIDDMASVIALLGSLRRLGVSVALDDFGTGYSSMAYLRRLPIDILKIDQSFIRDMEKDESARNIVRAIIALAKSLGKTVVAEGIETQVERDLLVGMGCDEGQGYFFSRPLDVLAFESLLRTNLASLSSAMRQS
jgi:diguanylate cyclase